MAGSAVVRAGKRVLSAVYGRTDRRLVTRAGVVVASACLALALCYALLIHTSSGRRIDGAIYAGSIRGSWPRIGFIDRQMSNIDRTTLKLVMLVLVGVGFLRRRPVLGLGAAFVAGGSVVAGHTLRYHVLDRAPFLSGPAWATSFPSDHATVAISVAMALVMVCPPRWRGPIAAVSGGAAAAVSTQVQVIGWHHLSDVLGAGFLSLAFTAGVAALLGMVRPGPRDSGRRPWWSLGLLGAGAGGTILAGVTALRGLHLSGGLSSATVQDYLSRAGLDFTVAVVVSLLAVEVYLLQKVDFDPVWPVRWRRSVRQQPTKGKVSAGISGGKGHDHQ